MNINNSIVWSIHGDEKYFADVCFHHIVSGGNIFKRNIDLIIPIWNEDITNYKIYILLDQLKESFGGIEYEKIIHNKKLNIINQYLNTDVSNYIIVNINIDNIFEKYKKNELFVYKFITTAIRYLFENDFYSMFILASNEYIESKKNDLITEIFISNYNYDDVNHISTGYDYTIERKKSVEYRGPRYNTNHTLIVRTQKGYTKFDPSVYEIELDKKITLKASIINLMPKLQ